MAKIRRTIISEIYSALEKNDFSLSDFKVDLEETKAFVLISFLPFPEYTFEITERDVAVRSLTTMLTPSPADMKLFTIESPGEYKTSASRQYSSIHDCISRIPLWCENIQSELSAPIPEPVTVEEFEKELNEAINNKAGDSVERFNEEEVSALKEKLEALNEKFEKLQKSNNITEKELSDVKIEVERMKSNLTTYPKSTWYKVSGHKILDMMKNFIKTKEGKDLLASSIKSLIEKL